MPRTRTFIGFTINIKDFADALSEQVMPTTWHMIVSNLETKVELKYQEDRSSNQLLRLWSGDR